MQDIYWKHNVSHVIYYADQYFDNVIDPSIIIHHKSLNLCTPMAFNYSFFQPPGKNPMSDG